MCATGAGTGADVGPTMTLHRIGNERQPVVVIDDFAADPDALRAAAIDAAFGPAIHHYPG
ncbi:MAG: hypothetical protein JWM65_209, partial [Sphingomonas bacterium]|nr:hypothetical protein [Sphingomonas bacterium]